MLRFTSAAWLLAAATADDYPVPPGLKLQWLGADSPKCLDGSPTGYYLGKSSTGSTNWVVYLQGGSMCFNEDDCAARKDTWLGSSKYWASELDKGSGGELQLLSAEPLINPDFHDFNHLYVPYCSGDVFVGKQRAPTNPWAGQSDELFYFQGFDLFTNITDALLQHADKVLLTGCSAGGIGTFFVADYLSAALPNAVVKASPEAGWFGFGPFDDWAHFEQGVPDPDPYHINGTHGWLGQINLYVGPAQTACYGDPSRDWHLCGFVPFIYKHIQTPFFIAENTADSFQVTHTAGLPQYGPLWTQTERDYIAHFGGQMRASLEELVLHGPKNATDGLFAPACYAHFMDWDLSIDGVSWVTALGNWFFERPGKTQLMDSDTSYSNFMSCAAPPPG